MRVPVAVEGAEAGGGERLVDRRIGVEPRVALGDGAGVACELLGELRIEQVGIARAAAVVEKPGDGADAERLEAAEALVGPAPVVGGR